MDVVQNAQRNVQGDAARPNTTSPACSSARSAAGSACAFPLVSMATKLSAPVTITGRPSKVAPSALDSH